MIKFKNKFGLPFAMKNYRIEYHMKSLMIEGAKPEGPYNFKVAAESMEKAAEGVIPKLVKIGFLAGPNDIWNARVVDSENERNYHQILKEGSWLVDFKTGKSLPLEKRF